MLDFGKTRAFEVDAYVKYFSDEFSCQVYMLCLKISYRGCRKCGGRKFEGRKPDRLGYRNSLRCSSCKYKESPKAHSLFEGSKVPLTGWFACIRHLFNYPESQPSEVAWVAKVDRETSRRMIRKVKSVMPDGFCRRKKIHLHWLIRKPPRKLKA